ncbi:alpha/beta fold hydrolase [Aquihabitans sp. McL0605]|uniref:alpha/beta fold hydrolase n=1 Tax=Aquihabitans sp. McL0605 TaxID=3415671 RepID=UPI003CF8F847
MATTTHRSRQRAFVAALAAVLALASLAGCSKSDPDPVVGATMISAGGVDVNAIVRTPTDLQYVDGTPLTALFLHGQSYTSDIWLERGILDAVANKTGFRAVAIDLPGHGDTDERKSGSESAVSDGTWLRSLVDKLGGPAHVVIVSPSMSGRYSLGYLEQYPKDALLGFVPVAPVGIDDFKRPASAFPVQAMSIWGSKDPTYSPERAAHLLTQMRGGDGDSTHLIQGAGHACYDDDPKAFTALLVSFLTTVH